MDDAEKLRYQTDLELWRTVFSKSLLLFVTILAGAVVADVKNIINNTTAGLLYGFLLVYLAGAVMMFITLKVTLKNKLSDSK